MQICIWFNILFLDNWKCLQNKEGVPWISKTIATITASACALSAFSFFPSISEASELNKSTKSVEVQNVTNDLNNSFVTNYASLDLDAGTSYVDVSPGGGSDGYNQYVSSRTVRNTANERSLLIGLLFIHWRRIFWFRLVLLLLVI